MPRKKRNFRLNHLHHVMLRGINGQNIFLRNSDYVRFCLLLQEACEKHSLVVHAFCFMTNHVHLVLEPLKDSFQAGVHSFAFRYAQYFNRIHKRKGYLFQGRFKSILVEDGAYHRRLVRYIHLNPVEANVVQRPENFRWSSYRGYLEQDHYVWLKTDRILSKFGESRQKAIEQFIEHTYQKMEANFDLEVISKAFRKGAFGSEEFVEEMNILKSEHREDHLDWSLTDLIITVCNHFNVTIEDLKSQDKRSFVVDARSILALMTRKLKKWPLEELAVHLNKNSGTLSKLASRAEKQAPLLELIKRIIFVK